MLELRYWMVFSIRRSKLMHQLLCWHNGPNDWWGNRMHAVWFGLLSGLDRGGFLLKLRCRHFRFELRLCRVPEHLSCRSLLCGGVERVLELRGRFILCGGRVNVHRLRGRAVLLCQWSVGVV